MITTKTQVSLITLVLSLFLIVGCATPRAELFPPDSSDREIEIWVVSHGWHVGLVLPNDSSFQSRIPPGFHAPDHTWTEVGWGDRKYYTGEQRGLWGMIRGALWPTASVVHLAAFSHPVEQEFRGYDKHRVLITSEGYDLLLSYLNRTLQKDSDGNLIKLKDGLYADSKFYASDRKYYLPRTSNTWAARLLREAGAPITPWISVTSGRVMRTTGSFSTPDSD